MCSSCRIFGCEASDNGAEGVNLENASIFSENLSFRENLVNQSVKSKNVVKLGIRVIFDA